LYTRIMEILRFGNLASQKSLVHGISTTDFGNMSFKWGEYEQVRKNRQTFFHELDISEEKVVAASLLHGNRIVEVTESNGGNGIFVPEESISGDILVTNKPDTFLFMVVADCLALFYYEPVKRVVALAHAGWRGVDKEVPEKVVNHMVKEYDCDPKNILVGFSPAIQKKSYTDKVEVVTQAHTEDERWLPYLHETNGLYEIDFVGFAYDQLLKAGIPAKNIENTGIDTWNDPQFFSHRRSLREKVPNGRFGCVIGIKK
jgi:YfiH family protein